MIKKKLFLFIVATLLFTNIYGQINPFSIDYRQGLAIWFDMPSTSYFPPAWSINNGDVIDNPDKEWEQQSLPIGNGNFGANILGSVACERITLNEKTLWMGGPGANPAAYWDMNNSPAPILPKIRKLLESGQIEKAQQLTEKEFQGKTDYNSTLFGSFTTMGEINIETFLDEKNIQDYLRILNIDSSLAIVRFKEDNNRYQRDYFASYPDQVMVIRFLSEKKEQDLVFSFQSPHVIKSSFKKNEITYNGTLENNGEKFTLRVLIRTPDGKVSFKNGKVEITKAREVEFIMAAATSYELNFNPDFEDAETFFTADPEKKTATTLKEAKTKSFQQLIKNHTLDYTKLFNKVELSLFSKAETKNDLPTDRRLKNIRNGEVDLFLETLYFQYGRYLLISSSRQGEMPANLQGIWHNNIEGPWRVDYHNNINLQMNYWLATTTNLLDCYEPLINYIRSLVVPGRKTAQSYYGARGWTASISGNIYGFTAPLKSSDMTWNFNPVAGPWLATHLWTYFTYSQDIKWLKEIGYPLLKESANFVVDLVYKNRDGQYTVAPSWSPEHGKIDMGATYCNAVVQEVLKDAVAAAKTLNLSTAESKQWQVVLQSIAPYKIGHFGQLQEWYKDIDDPQDRHRHTNHLFGLHPGSTISPLKTPELAEACKVTLNQRGDLSTGWSMGWKINHWARLQDGNRAHHILQVLLQESTADNLFDLHPPFQIDGNFGGTAGIAEMLLQSNEQEIILLPALPDVWESGFVCGLLAAGGITVDIKWENHKFAEVNFSSPNDTVINIIYNGKRKTIGLKAQIPYHLKNL